MKLEELQAGQRLAGVIPGEVVQVVQTTMMGPDASKLVFRGVAGLQEQILRRSDEADLETASERRPFDAPAREFRLAAEALRISNAGVFEPMAAVTTSAIQPLPHQLRAVYQDFLPRQPLRFLLADDPGAGKTIMAGLYIKELWLREDVRRCLVVAPGGLVEQWQDELAMKFGLEFELLGRDLVDAPFGSHLVDRHPRLIARMDQLARNEEWLDLITDVDWDLIVVDEAHRMSAAWVGRKLERTGRYRLGEKLGRSTRHLLLMTATPHSGKQENFQAFLRLLDQDRFAGKFKAGLHSRSTDGIMLRRVKEELLTFEGKPLFPDRRADTVAYELSPAEQALYEDVSEYVRTEMNRADRLDGSRRTTVGFALTVLQRRLASSPLAILRSLERRAARLRTRRDDLANGRATEPTPQVPDITDASWDEEWSADDLESLEDEVLDAATAAATVAELDAELVVLDQLVQQARAVRAAGSDRKWNELRDLLDEQTLTGGRRLIIFTEHRDTLEYLRSRISVLFGTPHVVEAIHGGVPRAERRRITEEFTHNPECRILLATDAAGEGLNLQVAHLMVNYDLPWNPNRIEQRFGRIHRIGQTEVCRLWNLVAADTREGQVFLTLLAKIKEQEKALGGKVFDVLGQPLTGASLRELLIEAIRYGERPEVRARMQDVIDATWGDGIEELLAQRALAPETAPAHDLERLRREMDEARARRLQPHFIEAAFVAGFHDLGGRMSRREPGRWEILNVPASLRQGRAPVARRYERVTFDLDCVEGAPQAELLAPGHPLHDAVMRVVLERWGTTLGRGAVLVHPEVTEPTLLVGALQEVVDATGAVIDQCFSYAFVAESLSPQVAGPAPYLDGVQVPEVAIADRAAALEWLPAAEEAALDWLAAGAGADHLDAVRMRRSAELEKTRAEVTRRLGHEVNRLYADSVVAKEENPEAARRLAEQAEEMQERLTARRALIDRQERMRSSMPELKLVAVLLPESAVSPEAAARARETKRIERRAVEATMHAEEALGRTPIEQPFNNKGFDILSEVPGGDPIRIEVKGRIKGADTFNITRSEILLGRNAAPRYRLAVVLVDPDDASKDEIRYVDDPFHGVDLGDFGATTVTVQLSKLWPQAEPPF